MRASGATRGEGVASLTCRWQDLGGEPLLRMGMAWAVRYAPLLEVLNVWTPLETPRIRPHLCAHTCVHTS